MIDDREVYDCAKLLIDTHGNDAEVVAALKLDALLDEGDVEGCCVWRLVLSAIVQLRQCTPGPDDLLN